MSTPESAGESQAGLVLPGWLIVVMHVVITAGLPLVLVLLNARVLMSNAYLKWEYNRPNFPEDSYGFTQEARQTYAPLALDYLFNDEGIEFLGDQTFPDGSPLYNERELSHMYDVKVVTQGLMRFGFGLLGVVVVSVILLAASPDARPTLYKALFMGSVITVGLIIAGLVLTATSFNWLFTQFHGLFFEGDSWIFLFSDTLIRLFPIRFWVDAFALMFGGALVEAIIIGVVMWRLMR
jgi:integral membrane protein (TIGR01906 family)